ncbi:MAG TPA: hypothetical protein VN253_25435 [Kofleriaceae bacterium]|nr:hypothetical protein [Kofleriaceae bacterium]
MAPDADLAIDDVLEDLGFVGENARLARAALEAAGLTNARKKRIAASKLDALQRVLDEQFLLLCSRPSCRASGTARGRVVLDAARATACGVCHGSPNAAEIDRAVQALVDRGLRRIVIVGGSPSTREELRDLVGDRLELRLVSGTVRRTARDAKADLAWADLVAIWGGTELDHTISKHYTDASTGRVVTCPRRGIEAMAQTLMKAAES